MRKLSLSFALLTCSGYWRPVEWPIYSLKYWLYNVYSAFMISLLYTFMLYALIDCLISRDLQTLTNKLSLVISVLGVCLKVVNLFFQREKIINVVDSLLKEDCMPKDEQEAIIQRRFDDYARKLTIYCEILNESAVAFATVAQLDQFIRTKTLTLLNWTPYGLSTQGACFVSLLHQTLGLIICANASVANETLIAGLMIQASAKFEIFCHRMQNLSNLLMKAERNCTSIRDLRNKNKRILRQVVHYHLEIYKFAETINKVFQYVIFLQFSISSTVLCLSIYKISATHWMSIGNLWNFFYLCCMLMQVYLYCWIGNEVILKSKKVSNAVYEIDWTILSAKIRKDLLIIMARSTRPVKMTSGHIVTLSVDSFMSIMKVTYSSYNLLKGSIHSSNK